MKVIHLIGGGDTGGAKTHVLHLVRELGKTVDVKMVTFLPGVFTDEARGMDIDVDMYRRGFFWINVFRVARHIKKEKYDIIHSHGAKGNTAAVICKFLTGVPVITTIHSDYRLDYMNNIWKKYTNGLLNSVALRFIDKYVAVSDNFRQMMISRGFDEKKVYTLYNGIEFPECNSIKLTEYPEHGGTELHEEKNNAPDSAGKAYKELFEIGRPLVGFSLRKWKRDVDIAGIFAEAGNRICDELGGRVVLFPLHYDKDLDLAEDVAQRMSTKPLIVKGHYTPAQLSGMYGLMHINVCIRFHGLVFSLSNNVPVVAVSYDPKIDSLMDYMGNRILHYRDLDAETLYAEIRDKWEKRNELSAEIAVKVSEFRVLARIGMNEVINVIRKIDNDKGMHEWTQKKNRN